MIKKAGTTISARDFMPESSDISTLRAAARSCRGCHLYKHATQTVFGEGAIHAKLIIIGEIPGDREDQLGKPFVGPAGTLLRNSIETVGLDIEDIYFTNVVKHFKFEFINKRKIHRSPVSAEIRACIPWLEAEVNSIQPKAILCLGATAAKSLISNKFKIRDQRGKWFPHAEKIKIMATFHPSAILRAIDHESRREMKQFFVRDIRKVAHFLSG